MKRKFFMMLLVLCSNVVFAEYAIVNNIVYSFDIEDLEAVVLNFQTTGTTVTIPSYVTYRGEKYKVTAISRYDFDRTQSDSYNTANNTWKEAKKWYGDGELRRAVTNQAYKDAERKREAEAAFKYDYANVRAGIISLNLPKTLVYIDKYAFDGMIRLKSLVIPASVKQLPPRGLHVFYARMSRLESITILGLPSYEDFNDSQLPINTTDKNGNLDYVECLKRKFDIDYCPNLKTFSVPEFEKRIPELQAELKNNQVQVDNDVVYSSSEVDQLPEFPGGKSALSQYLSENMRYPIIAAENGIQGTVICQFVVNADGSISDIKVLRSIDPYIDKEAIRLIQNMPNWNPGMLSNQKVKVLIQRNIPFRLY